MSILKEHPITEKLLVTWAIQRLLESVDKNVEYPPGYLEGMTNVERVVESIEQAFKISPVLFFPFFDENKLYINIIPVEDVDATRFTYSIGSVHGKIFNTRKEAEYDSCLKALSSLENNLKPDETN